MFCYGPRCQSWGAQSAWCPQPGHLGGGAPWLRRLCGAPQPLTPSAAYGLGAQGNGIPAPLIIDK